ncbi:MAG: NAD-dependent epimerase/dehydratase family protein [Dehalococcoidia bacterium]
MSGTVGEVLVVGGTGPTGVPIVNSFLRAGYAVAIYHSGAHEAAFDGEVEHLHGDPRDPDNIRETVHRRACDIAVCTSGRLRVLAAELAGKTKRFVGITGQPVYSGTLRPTPEGRLPLPVPEWAERQRDASNYTGKVAEGEDQLLEQHGRRDFEAVIVRYPGVFGPRAPINHEWAVVKRILDRRPFMIMPHDGMTYFQRGYIDNVARLVYLAATRPEAAGQAFNAGDEQVLSARHVAALIVKELSSEMELIGIPAPFCRGIYPLAEKSNLILDMSKARSLLGYRDVVDVETATRLTARWLVEHPLRAEDLRSGGPAGGSGGFDYEREDRILEQWRRLAEAFASAEASKPASTNNGAGGG